MEAVMGLNVAIDMRRAQLVVPDVDPVSDLLAFAARCETRGQMVADGLMTVQEAVDGLWEVAALPGGPLRFLDIDSVQEILANAFERGLAYAHTMPEPEERVFQKPDPPRRRELPKSTIDALRYVVRLRDPERMRRFLKGRSPDELAEMQRLMVANDRKN
jgi:hypothetical protein